MTLWAGQDHRDPQARLARASPPAAWYDDPETPGRSRAAPCLFES